MAFYAILFKSGKSVICMSWKEAEARIRGMSHARHKKLNTRVEAEAWIEKTKSEPLPKKLPPSDISKGECMRLLINTLKW